MFLYTVKWSKCTETHQTGYALQCCHLKADCVVGVLAALQVSRALAVYHNTATRSPAPHSQHSALTIVCKILL